MIVLDASALVDVVLDEPVASWVLDQIDGEDVAAPAHQPAEVLSAVGRIERAGRIDATTGRAALAAAASLPQRLVPATLDLLLRAYTLRDGIRVLDGLYVALAEELGAALVTTDVRLGRAVSSCDVRFPPDHGAGSAATGR